ncbi:hypothetical protein, partial [Mesorhizobium sp. M7A.F.Ca.US.011.01.1.1]|uniref:hypothetical protein n=1 Tax=Mesorhizobium sp. M7A.F.Ca.US.011.01.1.1 TaxID=2496741 RepID=UPI0019CF6C77
RLGSGFARYQACIQILTFDSPIAEFSALFLVKHRRTNLLIGSRHLSFEFFQSQSACANQAVT